MSPNWPPSESPLLELPLLLMAHRAWRRRNSYRLADIAKVGAAVARLLTVLLIAFPMVVAAAESEERRKSRAPDAAPKHVEFAGGDGNGCDRAVVIRGSRGSRDIVASEMAWLGARYPGYKFMDNTVETRGKRTFEEITIETAAGGRKVVCFEITEGFGDF